MQSNDPNEIKCPHITALIIYSIYIFAFVGGLYTANALTIILDLSILILYFLIYLFTLKGIKQKLFYLYKRALIISFILSIVSTIYRIIAIIVLSSIDTDTKAERRAKKIVMGTMIAGFFFDWILTAVLFFYKNKVKNYCETSPTIANPTIPIESDNTAALV